jgi:hypothetical protein
MNYLKALIPGYRSCEVNETQKTLHTTLCGILVVSVFLPWIYYSTLEIGKTNEIASDSVLGITTWYGIAALVTAIVAGFGVIKKEYAITFWACVGGAILGYIGTQSYADIKIDDYIIFKETFEESARNGNVTGVNHWGAKIFTIVSCLLAGFSLSVLFSDKEEKEESPLAKVTLGLSIFLFVFIAIDAIILKPTVFSIIAANIYTWGLPIALILLLAYSFATNMANGKSNKLNMYALSILLVALIFSNPEISAGKARCQYRTFGNNVDYSYRIHKQCYDKLDVEKELEKKAEDAMDDELTITSPGENIYKKGYDRDSYDSDRYYYEGDY